MVSMHVATSGQSGQLLFFCPSGQHGMSPDMADISLISLKGSSFAAAGATSGAAASPTITKTASRRPMSRRRFMTHHHTGLEAWQAWSTSHACQDASKTEKPPNLMWLTVTQAASADLFRAQRAHKGLPTTGSEKNNVIGLRLTALHPE